jgi:hypothetical protein
MLIFFKKVYKTFFSSETSAKEKSQFIRVKKKWGEVGKLLFAENVRSAGNSPNKRKLCPKRKSSSFFS